MTYPFVNRAGRCGVWTHLARIGFFAHVVVLLVVGLAVDGDSRFKEFVEVAAEVLSSVVWSQGSE